MGTFQRHPANVLYKGTILLACLAFLIGVAGIIYFHHKDQRGLPEDDAASVLVHGVEHDPAIQVVANWEVEAETPHEPTKRSETARLGDEPGIFLFRRAPEGVPIELVVYRHGEGGRTELHRQPAILTYGQNIFTAVPRPSDEDAPR